MRKTHKVSALNLLACFLISIFIVTNLSAQDTSVTRRLLPNETLFPGQSFTIYLDIVPQSPAVSFSLEEYYPAQFQIVSSSNFEMLASGRLGFKTDSLSAATTLQYQLSVPLNVETGEYEVFGSFRENSMESNNLIAGTNKLSIRETTGLVVSREFPSNELCAGDILDVFLEIDPGYATFYTLEDLMPEGWNVVDENGDIVPGNSRRITSFSLSPPTPQFIHYRVKAPEDANGFYEIRGEYGDNELILKQIRGEVSIYIKNNCCTGDFENDGDIDGSDVSFMSNNFPLNIITDLTADGIVDTDDLTRFSSRFGINKCAKFPELKDPILLSPIKNSVLDNGCQDHSDIEEWYFEWFKVEGANKYQLYVIHEGATIPIINEIIYGNSFTLSDNGYIADFNRFNWIYKVRAGNQFGQWGPWSKAIYFEVEPVNTDCQGQMAIINKN